MEEPRTIYEGARFSVVRHRAHGSDGVERSVDIVAHPGAAVILPILDDGRVVMIRNYRWGPGVELLELPAGTLEPPEPPLECARREVEEETGYRARRLEPLLKFYTSPGICSELMHAFVATGLEEGPTRHEPLENIRVERMSIDDALAAVREGRIMDGKSVATLLYYDAHRQAKGVG